ncbi:unnamed protein product, partial [Mesorhabditis belari]|uniref:Uncharacterized protein n=1 Tax=Mesorhabditis belari TaxID=2138241 RepID=A0AAF3EMJ7_9BILA
MIDLLFYFLPFWLYLLFWLTRLYWERVRLDNLHERPVLITGCDYGFAYDAAIELAKLQVPVFAACYTQDGMRKIQAEAEKIHGARLMALPLDVTDDESVERMGQIVDKECKRYGGLWAVINSAGVALNLFIDEFLTCEDYYKTMDTNLYGLKRVVNRVAKLIKQKKGRVVNVTSILARCPVAGIGPYVISKHAAGAYTDVIRKELAMFGVKVITIEPGFFRTNMSDLDRIAKENWGVWDRTKSEIKDEYGYDFVKTAIDNQALMMKMVKSETTTRVVHAYVKSVTSVYARRRYKVGFDTWFLWHPMSLLPTNLQDIIFYYMSLAIGGPPPASLLPHCSHCKLKENTDQENII